MELIVNNTFIPTTYAVFMFLLVIYGKCQPINGHCEHDIPILQCLKEFVQGIPEKNSEKIEVFKTKPGKYHDRFVSMVCQCARGVQLNLQFQVCVCVSQV